MSSLAVQTTTGPETNSPPASPSTSDSSTSSTTTTTKPDIRVETSATTSAKENMLSNFQSGQGQGSKAPTPGSSATPQKSSAPTSGSSATSQKSPAPTHPVAWNGVALATTEAQLVSALSTLLTNLNRCGDRLGLTKSNVLTAGRAKKTGLTPQVWTKNVARLFGAVLKRTNAIEALFQQRQADFAKYGDVSGALQEFGCLHGDQYSQVRVMHQGGLVPECRFVSVECGGQHTVALTSDGRVYSWGAGSFGQLGNKKRTARTSPDLVDVPKCQKVACGYAYSCAVTVDGNIYSWGAGENGRLGTGSSQDELTPVLVTTDWKAINIFAGSVHTCAIGESGQMYTWGHKNYTGHGTDSDVMEPKLLDRFDGKLMHSASIGPGGYHTIALSISGDVYTWGHNRVGQLGFENEEATQQTSEGAFFYEHPEFVRALSSRPVRQVAAGWGHSMVLCWDGSVLACGRNFRGQLGQDPSTCTLNERGHPYCSKFTQVQSLQGMKMERIACGGEHSAAIAEDGSLYIWGDDSCGQLAHELQLSEVYSSDDSRSHFNPHAYRVTGEPSVQGVMDIALGSSVSFVITAEDE